MKFSIKGFFSKCEFFSKSFLRIWSYLLRKSLMENLRSVKPTDNKIIVNFNNTFEHSPVKYSVTTPKIFPKFKRKHQEFFFDIFLVLLR